jgi:hypothetical protein
MTFQVNGSERARIDSSGNLLIGTTTTSGNAGFQFLPNAGSGFVASIDHVTGVASGAFTILLTITVRLLVTLHKAERLLFYTTQLPIIVVNLTSKTLLAAVHSLTL